jgi:uncharacterized membrane-anchored protein YhcB (DUF1043 family)
MISRHTTRLFQQRMIQKTLKNHKDHLEKHDKRFESIFAGSVGLFIGLVYVSHLAKKSK